MSGEGTKKVPFRVYRWDDDQVHLLLDVVINNEWASFIVDTGASTSVIDKKFHDRNAPVFTEVPMVYNALSNIGQVEKKVLCENINFGFNIVLSHTFYVADLQFIQNTYEQIGNEKPPVALLGCDFLLNSVTGADFVENFFCFR